MPEEDIERESDIEDWVPPQGVPQEVSQGTSRRAIHQVMRPMSPDEFHSLKESIRQYGVLVDVVVDSDGNILDGHHRRQAYLELRAEGVDLDPLPIKVQENLETGQERRDFAREINSSRRAVTLEERRELVASQLRETPERSDAWVADMLGVGDAIVGTTRLRLEVAGDIPVMDRVMRRDGVFTQRHRKTPRDRYPGLAPFTHSDALKIARALDKLPERKRREVHRRVEAFDPATLSELLGRPIEVGDVSIKEVADGHAGHLWHQGLSSVYSHLSSVGRSNGFLPLVRRWDPDTREYYLEEVKRIKGILSSWEEILEQTKQTQEEEVNG